MENNEFQEFVLFSKKRLKKILLLQLFLTITPAQNYKKGLSLSLRKYEFNV